MNGPRAQHFPHLEGHATQIGEMMSDDGTFTAEEIISR